MNDVDGITHTLNEFCLLMDDQRFDEWANMFTEDGELTAGGTVTKSRIAIRQKIEAAYAKADGAQVKHITLNPVIEIDGDGARVVSMWQVLVGSPRGPFIAQSGRYVDRLVREQDRWRFAAREVVSPTAGFKSPDWSG
jgi:3-phenylpropionate/cinnamic acid dioxygenase small subunit